MKRDKKRTQENLNGVERNRANWAKYGGIGEGILEASEENASQSCMGVRSGGKMVGQERSLKGCDPS